MNYANHHGYTDVHPYEVVRHVSAKTLDVRAMKAERDPTWKPEFVPGGFSAHCTNQNEQRWVITPDGDAPIVRIRLNAKGQWKDKHGNTYRLADKPVRFYDYNF